MELLGKRVLLFRPEIKELNTTIQLDEATKAKMAQESIKNFTRLKVAAVGDEVTNEKLKKDVEVFIPLSVLKYAEYINVENTEYILVGLNDVALIY